MMSKGFYNKSPILQKKMHLLKYNGLLTFKFIGYETSENKTVSLRLPKSGMVRISVYMYLPKLSQKGLSVFPGTPPRPMYLMMLAVYRTVTVKLTCST